jgi:DNA-binding NtrC family response regulator
LIRRDLASDVGFAAEAPAVEMETGETPIDDGREPNVLLLRLVRALEGPRKSVEGQIPVLLGALRELLDATGVVLGEGGPEGISVRSLSGSLEADLEETVLRTAGAIGEFAEPSLERSATHAVLLGAARRDGRSRFLAAVLAGPGARPVPWQIDLFGLVARKLIPLVPMPAALVPCAPPSILVPPPSMILGTSPAMSNLLAQIRATVRSRADVLLTGESGTGKELFARMIHDSGPHPEGPYIAINCAAIPSQLLESELFGVQKGVATGVDPRLGRFVQADGGSIFLDEIGELADNLQAKLLRVLQEREILPLGAQSPRRISVRVISATNCDLDDRVRNRRFRADLFYRLRGLRFHIPPLRDRKEDLPELVIAFASVAATEAGKMIRGVSKRALDLLLEHDWPGNVRELQTDVNRAVLTCPDGGVLVPSDFGHVRWVVEERRKKAVVRDDAPSLSAPSGPASGLPPASWSTATAQSPSGSTAPRRSPSSDRIRPLREIHGEADRKAILAALEKTKGNKSQAARRLGLSRNGLAARTKELGIEQ